MEKDEALKALGLFLKNQRSLLAIKRSNFCLGCLETLKKIEHGTPCKRSVVLEVINALPLNRRNRAKAFSLLGYACPRKRRRFKRHSNISMLSRKRGYSVVS